MQGISPREFMIGLLVVGIAIIIGAGLRSQITKGWTAERLRYQLSYKTDEPSKLSYVRKTEVGDVLAYGELEAIVPVSLKSIKGEYLAIAKVTEQYNMHTRQVSYSCGTTDAPRTCYRTETYYTWDYYDEEKAVASRLRFMGEEIANIKIPDLDRLDINNGLVSGKICYNYIYLSNNCYWTSVGNRRVYYKSLPTKLRGTLFVRFFEGRTTNPLDDRNPIDFYRNRTQDEVIKERGAFMTALGWVAFVLVLVIISGGYFYLAAENDII